MHDIERELIEATGYKARQKYANRQDYLKSILNAVAKLTDDDFDALTDDTALWVNAAVEAHNSKNEEIVDFDELDSIEESEFESETEDEASEEEAEVEDETVDPETGEVLDEDSEVGDELPHDEETETEDEPEEADEPPLVKILKEKPKTLKAKNKAKMTGRLARQVPRPEPKKPKPAPAKFHPLHSDEDVILDKWGCMEGSKNSQALALFEQGATASEVKRELGGTYYNILGRCVANGHKMEKEGHIIKLTHKSELGKKAPVKATPAKKKVK